jgi:hypothetical protein
MRAFPNRGDRSPHFLPEKEFHMMSKRMSMTVLTAALVAGAAGLAAAADAGPAKPGMHGMGEMPMGQGMMGDGMMGMMDSCRKMTGSAMPGGAAMPHLPPGNEKLEFQMHAEMMQKMGEIAAKYAERIKEAK